MPTKKSQEILTMLLLDGIQGARQTISACIYLDYVDLADILLQHCFLHRATRFVTTLTLEDAYYKLKLLLK